MTIPSVLAAIRADSAKARQLLLQLASDVLDITAAADIRVAAVARRRAGHAAGSGEGEARQRDDRRIRLARPERTRRQGQTFSYQIPSRYRFPKLGNVMERVINVVTSG